MSSLSVMVDRRSSRRASHQGGACSGAEAPEAPAEAPTKNAREDLKVIGLSLGRGASSFFGKGDCAALAKADPKAEGDVTDGGGEAETPGLTESNMLVVTFRQKGGRLVTLRMGCKNDNSLAYWHDGLAAVLKAYLDSRIFRCVRAAT